MLSARGLSCIRGERRLFSEVDLVVNPGEWVHVRGQNGVGKTSLLRILVGLASPESGQIYWDDAPITTCRDLYHEHLLYQGHYACIKDELTAIENLRLAAGLDGVTLDEDRARSLLKLLDVLEESDDVQNVYANFEIPEDVMAKLSG